MNVTFSSAAFLWMTSPLWVPIYAVLLVTDLRFLPHERRLQARMKAAGRLGSLDALKSGGTIIHDLPTMSWGVSRLWWTPDDVMREAPVPPPTSEEASHSLPPWSDDFRWHAFDRWVWERYLNPENGTAMLLQSWRVGKLLKQVRKRFPTCPIVVSFSGGKNSENFPPLASRQSVGLG